MKIINIFLLLTISIIVVSSFASAFWPVDWIQSKYFKSDKPPEFYITSPINGSTFQEGHNLNIKWKKINFPGKEAVGVLLTRLDIDGNEVYSKSIARDISFWNSYNWKIPKGLNGTFRIEIYTQGIGIRFTDSKIINIAGYNTPPRIDYLTPNKGSLTPEINTGINNENELTELAIHGEGFVKDENFGANNIFIVFDNLRLGAEVFNKSNPYLFGALSEDGNIIKISPSKSFSESDVPPGNYELYIVNFNGKSNSVNLTIEEPTTPAITKILSPQNGTIWRIGNTYNIVWTSRHISAVNIAITNLKPTCSVNKNPTPSIPTPNRDGTPRSQSQDEVSQTSPQETCFREGIYIIFNTTNDGAESWKIPSTVNISGQPIVISPGNYTLTVTSVSDSNPGFKELDGYLEIIDTPDCGVLTPSECSLTLELLNNLTKENINFSDSLLHYAILQYYADSLKRVWNGKIPLDLIYSLLSERNTNASNRDFILIDFAGTYRSRYSMGIQNYKRFSSLYEETLWDHNYPIIPKISMLHSLTTMRISAQTDLGYIGLDEIAHHKLLLNSLIGEYDDQSFNDRLNTEINIINQWYPNVSISGAL